MLKVLGFLAVVTVAFMVWSLVEAISTDRRRLRSLSKPAWIALIVLLPLAGAVAWFVSGRPSTKAADADALPRPDRSSRKDATNPAEEAADYSTRLRERAEEQRRRYEQQQEKKDQPEAD